MPGIHAVDGNIEMPIRARESLYAISPLGLDRGARPYTDRPYTIKELPDELRNLTLLRTCMDHRALCDDEFKVTVKVALPFDTFLAIDERMLEKWRGLANPSRWIQDIVNLNGYERTSHRITTDDPVMQRGNAGYLVYKVVHDRNRREYGFRAPCGDKNVAMYFAFFSDR